LTNLLQPADVDWFATIKKAYRKLWNHWFTFDNHEYTRHANMTTPGYVLCSKWVSQIWEEFPADLIRKSFSVCGIHNDHQGRLDLRVDNLHSTLKQILKDEAVINNSIEMDMELVEAGNNMTNENNRDVFDEGCGEEDRLEEDQQMEEPDMDLLDLDQNELDILAELENDLTSPEFLETGHRVMRISPDLNNEINSIPYESSPEQITTEDDGSTFINLQSIITSAQPEKSNFYIGAIPEFL